MRAAAVIPALDAGATIGAVVAAAVRAFPDRDAVIVVDDGSTDDSGRVAAREGAVVVRHAENRGKGAALRTGFREASARGFDVAVTIDADGQHPVDEAARLVRVDADPQAFVLGIRDLVGAGAPRANRVSNGISNFFLSVFARRLLADTQCGLRRYPLALALALAAEDDGYAFEAEVILRAVAARARIVEVPVRVIYPPETERVSHFHSVRDPARIVARVVRTLVATRGLLRSPVEQRGDPMPAHEGALLDAAAAGSGEPRVTPPPSAP